MIITKSSSNHSNAKYGINERSKAELDLLNNQVLDAEHDVEQLQAIVIALNEKSTQFKGFLMSAELNKIQTLSNKNLIDQIVQNAINLKDNSKTALDEMSQADLKTKQLSKEIKTVIDKLIYSATVISKLSNTISRAKTSNPYLEEIMPLLADAGVDANNAVGLALVALKSTLAAETANIEAEAATTLEYMQAVNLYQILTESKVVSDKTTTCLKELINQAHTNAKQSHEKAFSASTETIEQLNKANASLSKAQIKLRSLQLSYAAGNAAILSS